MTVEIKPAWATFVLRAIEEAGGYIQQIQLVRKAAVYKGAKSPHHYTALKQISGLLSAFNDLLRERKISTRWVGHKKFFCLVDALPENGNFLPPGPRQNTKDKIAELEERLGRIEERLREVSTWKVGLEERLERWRRRGPEIIAFLEREIRVAVSKRGQEKTGV